MWKATCCLAVVTASILPLAQWPGAVVMLDPQLAVESLASTGPDLASPDGLFLVGDELYVADEGASAVRAGSLGGPLACLADESHGLSSPEDLVVDETGTVYVTDDDLAGVWIIRRDGTVEQVGTDAHALEAIARSPRGEIFVGGGDPARLFRLTSAGELEPQPLPPGLGKVESLACDEAGNLYLADDTRALVLRRSTDGRWERLLDAGSGLLAPETIAYRSGWLYIVDNEAGLVSRYNDREGWKPLARFGGELKNIQGLALEADGNVLVGIQTDLGRGQGLIVRLRRQTESESARPSPTGF